jgi:hypothetical protein
LQIAVESACNCKGKRAFVISLLVRTSRRSAFKELDVLGIVETFALQIARTSLALKAAEGPRKKLVQALIEFM